MNKILDGIDFVIPWVDGTNHDWLHAFNTYSSACNGDKRQCRYRDWDTLRYVFRGFEEFTPWVRKIHFVTWGHLPPWLNLEHPKLAIVRHSDFLDRNYLPVFNCNPLEVNLHRIPGLAERFVYFNDDTFLLKPIGEDYFFHKGLPRDMLVFNAIPIDGISHIRLNAIQIINDYFSKNLAIKNNLSKIFNLNYGLHQLRTLLLLPWPQITGMYDTHQPQPFLKKTFEEVWALNEEELKKTSSSKFRNISDVNQYLFRYWQLLKGDFCPRSFSDVSAILLKDDVDVDKSAKIIASKNYTMFCINDEMSDIDEINFELFKNSINDAFDSILPNKSSFEMA